ncbi:MAG TPA: hypothetical protein VEU96_14995 [Bryobacteraceae bacterium]|nr:hypothetical protein [Bryobacteraceae bacterium]
MITLLIAAGGAFAELNPVVGEAIQEPLQARSRHTQGVRKAQLHAQLSRILPTHDTSRGLVVEIPESVLGRSGKLLDYISKRLEQIAALLPPDVVVSVNGYGQQAAAVRQVLVDNDESPREIEVAFVRAPHSVEILISGPGLGPSSLPARVLTD